MTSVLVVVLVCAAAYAVLGDATRATRSYCAVLPDTVGLYTGSHVTMLGMPVGSVTGIRPDGDGVRVEFEVDAAHPLRGDVAAVTVSDTLVADRNLAMLSAAAPAAQWDSARCITRALTPKSMSQTLDALRKLAAEMGATDEPAAAGQVAGGLAALDRATSGTGPAFNALVTKLADALRAPDAAIGRIGQLIDAVARLSAVLKDHWGDLQTMLTRMDDVLDQVNNEVFPPVIGVIDDLRVILPWFNDITSTFGRPILNLLHASVPLARWVGANVGSLEQILSMIPTLADSFQRSTDPATGAPVLGYAAPRIALAQPDAEQICAALNTAAPGRCRSAGAGLAELDLVPVVLGMAGVQ
ncbi:MlaD family protein [Nocardia yamanashiensis]|uniref:MlaD family protein n=1 Tax=Nocardia yamanashiensis TaxID=209247 RepID=UPI001E3B09FF|nr:MlaD family protein [Nocardia yamanashiensis]UGT38833.1 MlaD family protein [Nocardia yamanashiensis]